ncbi:MAG: hypothetical protein ACKV2O_01085 [Acidimicrobiales bacterium]
MPTKSRPARVQPAAVNGQTKAVVVDQSAEDSVRAYLSFISDPSSSVDAEQISSLEKSLASSTDPLEQLRLAARLEVAKLPSGSAATADFIRDAKRWADAEGVSASAFKQMGVSDDVLRKAGILKSTRGGAKRRPATTERSGRRVTVDHIQTWALSQSDPFTIKDVTLAIGGSLVTANKALQNLVDEGSLSNLGPAEGHRGPGRAPARFAAAKRRRGKA